MKKDILVQKGIMISLWLQVELNKKPFFLISYSLTFDQHGLEVLFFKPASVVKINYRAVERKSCLKQSLTRGKGAFSIILQNSITEMN